MTKPTHQPHSSPTGRQTCQRARGFSLVEVIFALLLVGLVYVAAIDTLGAARANQALTHDHAVAYMLAQARMSEQLVLDYDDLASESKAEYDDRAGWSHAVEVDAVEPTAPDTVAISDKGVRRVRVTVYRGNAVLAELVALRTNAMPTLRTHMEALGP